MTMHLKILLPFRVFDDIPNVKRIVMETSDGAFGLLPQRLDCVAALVPGVFTYETESEHYIAINGGFSSASHSSFKKRHSHLTMAVLFGNVGYRYQ